MAARRGSPPSVAAPGHAREDLPAWHSDDEAEGGMRSGGLDAVAGGVRSGAQICGAAAGNSDAVARSAVSASWFHCRVMVILPFPFPLSSP